MRRRRLKGGPPAPPDDRRCRASRADGQRCSLWSKPSAPFCAQHGPRPEAVAQKALAALGERSNRGAEAATRSLTAAVARIKLDGTGWQTWNLTSREWQTEAWRLYDITGPLRFVVNSIAKTAAKAPLYVGERGDDGLVHEPTDDPQMAALATGPLGAGDDRAEAVRLICVNLQVAGEAYVVAEGVDAALAEAEHPLAPHPLPLEDADRWYVVSTEQISRSGDDIVIRRPGEFGGGRFTPVKGKDVLLRMWTPHPADIDEPDSPVRSAIPDLRELEALRKREFAELDSRLAGAGILAVPQDMDFPRGDADGGENGEGAEGGLDGFLEQVGEAMSTSMADRASAQAMVPIGLTGPGEALEQIRHITFWSELSEQILPMKESALKMLAMSLDAPVEMMQGMGQTNHWSAWLLDEQTIATHIEPLLAEIASSLTQGWLAVAAARLGRDPDQWAYKFETAALQVRGDKLTTALELHERKLISDAALRQVASYSETVVPSAEERLRRVAEDAIRIAPSIMLTDPEVRRILGLDPDAILLTQQQIAQTQGLVNPSPSRRPRSDENEAEGEMPAVPEAERGTPERPRTGDAPGNDRRAGEHTVAALSALGDGPGAGGLPPGLLPVCNLAVLRALELAGGRLVPRRPREAARHELHTRADVAALDRKGANEALKGAWVHLAPQVRAVGVADAGALQDLLHQYCTELLLRGVPHHSDLLEQVLVRAFGSGSGRGAP